MTKLLVGCSLLAVLLASAGARAQVETSHHSTYGVCDGSVYDPDCRVHDPVPVPMPDDDEPIYLRASIGALYNQAALRVEPADGAARKANVGAPMLGVMGAFGVSNDWGVNVGFELAIQYAFTTSVGSESGGFDQYEVTGLFAATGMLFVDWYLDPNDDGFHVQGGLGVGGLSYDAKRAAQDLAIEPIGWVGHAGIGYELGVTRHLDWSYGILLRVDAGYYGIAKAKPVPDLATPHAMFVAPGLYATLTLD